MAGRGSQSVVAFLSFPFSRAEPRPQWKFDCSQGEYFHPYPNLIIPTPHPKNLPSNNPNRYIGAHGPNGFGTQAEICPDPPGPNGLQWDPGPNGPGTWVQTGPGPRPKWIRDPYPNGHVSLSQVGPGPGLKWVRMGPRSGPKWAQDAGPNDGPLKPYLNQT